MAYFIQNPINYTVSPIAVPDKATFHRVIAEVSVGGMTFPQSETVSPQSSSIVFDIASSLRAYADSINFSAVTSSMSYEPISYSVKFHDEYMFSGLIHKSPDRNSSSGTALLGGFTDFERLSGSAPSAEQASLTLRPSSSPMLVPSGHPYLSHGHSGTSRSASFSSGILSGVYPVPDNYRWADFQFINTRGVHESAFAQCYSSESIKGGSQTHVRALRETFSSISRRLNVNDPSYASLSFSSGFVDLPWAKWWAYEFGKARQHWIKIGSVWVPCAVSVKDGASIINRAKTELLSVEFDVIPDVNGQW